MLLLLLRAFAFPYAFPGPPCLIAHLLHSLTPILPLHILPHILGLVEVGQAQVTAVVNSFLK